MFEPAASRRRVSLVGSGGFSGKVAGMRNLSFSCSKIKNELDATPVSVAIHGQGS